MKSHFTTLLIALVVGYFGGVSSQFFTTQTKHSSPITITEDSDPTNPFQLQTGPDDAGTQLAQLQKKVNLLETRLISLTEQQAENNANVVTPGKEKRTILNRPVSPNKENLLAAGVNPDNAEEVLRRISQQEFKRLELQNLIRRGGSSSQQYRKELRELNRNKISLRSELGDDTYDQYLFESGQNNRVKVTSVMAESPAELSGFEKDDVIIFYDDQKILSWPDIRSATAQGEIGSYTSVEILRDGARMSLMVPRGTLGVQLDAIQLDPGE